MSKIVDLEIMEGIKCPKYLNNRAKELFADYAKILQDWGVLSKADAASLGAMCHYQAKYEKMVEENADADPMVRGDNGTQKTNPAVRVEMQTYDKFFEIAKRFGLTPLDRENISIVKDGKVKQTGKKMSLR